MYGSAYNVLCLGSVLCCDHRGAVDAELLVSRAAFAKRKSPCQFLTAALTSVLLFLVVLRLRHPLLLLPCLCLLGKLSICQACSSCPVHDLCSRPKLRLAIVRP